MNQYGLLLSTDSQGKTRSGEYILTAACIRTDVSFYKTGPCLPLLPPPRMVLATSSYLWYTREHARTRHRIFSLFSTTLKPPPLRPLSVVKQGMSCVTPINIAHVRYCSLVRPRALYLRCSHWSKSQLYCLKHPLSISSQPGE